MSYPVAERRIMFATKPRFNALTFVACPLDVLATAISVDREEILDLYREAYEQAKALHGPSITERLAPSLN
jgi:hypothetical protein